MHTQHDRAGLRVTLDVGERFSAHGVQHLCDLHRQLALGAGNHKVSLDTSALLKSTDQSPERRYHAASGSQFSLVQGEDRFAQMFSSVAGQIHHLGERGGYRFRDSPGG
jgi:hypothetical protein